MAARMKSVSGQTRDYFDSYKKTPGGGTNKSGINSNEKLKKAPFGSSGMSAPVKDRVPAMEPKYGLSQGPKGGRVNKTGRNMGGNGKGKFPNMVKDMK